MKKFFPAIAFTTVALASLVLAAFAYFASQEAARFKFEALADDAVGRLESRLDLYTSLLRATEAFFDARSGDVSRSEFESFYEALDVDGNFSGLLSIGYLKLIRSGQEAAAEQEIKNDYGVDSKIFPATDLAWRTPLMLVEPRDKQTMTYLGFDVASDPVTREALEKAVSDSALHASGRRLLDPLPGPEPRGDSASPGFLIFARLNAGADPVNSDPVSIPTKGVLFAGFRASDLFETALAKTPLLPLSIEAYDDSVSDDNLLFRSVAPAAQGLDLQTSRKIAIAGRTWTVILRPTAAFTAPSSPMVPVVLGLFGLLLAGTIAMIARYQERTYDAVSRLRETAEKSLAEKDLMLQEMRHRIKNSIARVLAMARQTAAHSEGLKDFTESFSARLQSMAASQDMLTRSRWQKADLGDLLRVELGQVFGKDLPEGLLSGPQVLLDETTTQALGLTFHELATNALKYGEAGNSVGALKVAWDVEPRGQGRSLRLDWTETGQEKIAVPDKTGFGTKLIDMNITRELRGTIRRDFRENGLKVEITIPLAE